MVSSSPQSQAFRTATLLLVSIVVLCVYAAGGYVAYLNHRVTNELAHLQWRTPTEIYSDRDPSTPAVKVYGSDWRATTPVILSEIPSYVGNAFVAAEDVRFRHHIGIDPVGIARAIFTDIRAGGIAQGGSTIDQQLIKAKFLTQERTFRRKLVEMLLAVILDARMSKDEILEGYLNEVYLGHYQGRAVLGIDEASRVFFSKPPGRLTVSEAALVAGIIRAPNRDTPDKRPDLARARRNAILRQMVDHRWISRAQYDEAVNDPVRLQPGELRTAPFPYYLAALRSELVEKAGEGALTRTGTRIYCGLDPAMQRQAERAAIRGVAALTRKYFWIRQLSADGPLQTAVLSVDARTGAVRALVGGSDFRLTAFDRTTRMQRQPGSAFKPFAYFAAIESRKVTNATLVQDTPLEIELANDRTWQPHNYDERFRGRVTLREAFEKSLNVPTVRIAQEIGNDRIIRAAQRFGFQEHFDDIPALPLGVEDVSMRDIVAAYTVFPNLGVRVEPHLLTRVVTKGGTELYHWEGKPKRVAQPAPVFVVHSLMRGVVLRGTASRLKSYGLQNVAGKTGTTSDYRDAWFIGYTPDVVTGVWVGFDRGAALRLSSAEAALPIWGTYMAAVDRARGEIAPPDGVVFRKIDPESGMLWADTCPGPVREVFLSGTAPTHTCPRGFFGTILRHVLFDDENFDEPPAITFEQFRRWAAEVDQERQQVESTLDKLQRIFGSEEEDRRPNGRNRRGD